MRYKTIREECREANRRLPQTGLVDLTFGNVSVLDPEAGVFAIKPSGVDYAALRPEDMVVLDLDGTVVEGDLRPSSDTPTHRYLYRAFGGPAMRAIVHTHSRCAVAFAQAGAALPCLGTTHADHFYGTVPVTRGMTEAEVGGDYEWATGGVIAETFGGDGPDPGQVPAVFVRHHGPFAWGASADKAVDNALALEICADMALKTFALAPETGAIPPHLLDKHFLRKHGPGAYYGQSG